MKQRMGAANLIGMAKDILQENPLPDDSKNYNYQQRMALKALSIAVWDREQGAADRAEEFDLFGKLYPKEIVESRSADDNVHIGALNLVLATDIRVGMWDQAPPALWNLLMAQTRARLRRVNPKYLNARENRRGRTDTR